MSLVSGYGRASSSGSFSVRTAKAGTAGVSGSLSFTTGATTKGSSGTMVLRSGSATLGAGGSVSVLVGSGAIASGGRITMSAGEATAVTGGALSLVSGFGTAKSSGSFSVRTAKAGPAPSNDEPHPPHPLLPIATLEEACTLWLREKEQPKVGLLAGATLKAAASLMAPSSKMLFMKMFLRNLLRTQEPLGDHPKSS